MRFPYNASSFDIGIVNDEVEIPIEDIKPVFALSILQERNLGYDILELSDSIDEYLERISHTGNKGIIFVPGKLKNAYSISGNYELVDDTVNLRCTIVKELNVVGQFELIGNKDHIQDLVERVLGEVATIVN